MQEPATRWGSHTYNWFGDTFRNLCLQSLAGVEDHPDGGLFFGLDGKCLEAGVPPAAHPHASATQTTPHNCAAGWRCSRRSTERSKCTEGLLANGHATSSVPNCPAEPTRFKARREIGKRQGGFDEGQTDDYGTMIVPGISIRSYVACLPVWPSFTSYVLALW